MAGHMTATHTPITTVTKYLIGSLVQSEPMSCLPVSGLLDVIGKLGGILPTHAGSTLGVEHTCHTNEPR